MTISRRQMLATAVGASQLALLDRYGFRVGVGSARAANGPTRVMTIFFRGGWMPHYLFCPLSGADIRRVIPTPNYTADTGYFVAEQVKNLDGSGDADSGTQYPRIRVPQLWDTEMLSAGKADRRQTDPRSGQKTVPWGWAWVQHRLWENTCVVHGVDQSTAAHDSGVISAMSGAAGGAYRAPAIHSWVANAFYDLKKRPIPSVALEQPVPHPWNFNRVSPVVMSSLSDIKPTLSQANQTAWSDFDGSARPALDFSGKPTGQMVTDTLIDERVLASIRSLKGKSSEGTDAFLQGLYDGYQGVSNLLAADVVRKLEGTQGVEYTQPPFWTFGQWAWDHGVTNVQSDGASWALPFDLTLRLLKTNVTSAISLNGGTYQYFDSHNAGPGGHFIMLRPTFDLVGRLLGEMKSTPGSDGGKSLLDETLVIMLSDFARTWADPVSGRDGGDHWPITSVAFVGGGINTNRMIGNYDVASLEAVGGTPVDIIEEDGQMTRRVPRSGDVIHTALKVLGIKDFFIPGGTGEIVGVRA